MKPRHHCVGKLLEYVQDANCVNLAPIAATEDFTHTNDDIEEGWTILPIKWYDRRPDNTYTLLPRPHYLNVNATVRVPGLKWASKAQGRFTLSSGDYETIKNNI